MSAFSQSDLQTLWIQAGGDPKVAPLMSAIAEAESSGNSEAKNPDSGACGLWQIYPPEPNCWNPFINAQIAVRKYQTQGLKAWEAYTNGDYKKYLGTSATSASSSTAQSSDNCQSFKILGICWDNLLGLTAIMLGLGFITAGLVVMTLTSQQGRSVTKTAVKTAETVAIVAPK